MNKITKLFRHQHQNACYRKKTSLKIHLFLFFIFYPTGHSIKTKINGGTGWLFHVGTNFVGESAECKQKKTTIEMQLLSTDSTLQCNASKIRVCCHLNSFCQHPHKLQHQAISVNRRKRSRHCVCCFASPSTTAIDRHINVVLASTLGSRNYFSGTQQRQNGNRRKHSYCTSNSLSNRCSRHNFSFDKKWRTGEDIDYREQLRLSRRSWGYNQRLHDHVGSLQSMSSYKAKPGNLGNRTCLTRSSLKMDEAQHDNLKLEEIPVPHEDLRRTAPILTKSKHQQQGTNQSQFDGCDDHEDALLKDEDHDHSQKQQEKQEQAERSIVRVLSYNENYQHILQSNESKTIEDDNDVWIGLNVSKRQFIAFLRYNNVSEPSFSQHCQTSSTISVQNSTEMVNVEAKEENKNVSKFNITNAIQDDNPLSPFLPWIEVEKVSIDIDADDGCNVHRIRGSKQKVNDENFKFPPEISTFKDEKSDDIQQKQSSSTAPHDLNLQGTWRSLWKKRRLITARTDWLGTTRPRDVTKQDYLSTTNEKGNTNNHRKEATHNNENATRSKCTNETNGRLLESQSIQSSQATAIGFHNTKSSSEATQATANDANKVSDGNSHNSRRREKKYRVGFPNTIDLYVDRILSIYRDEIIEKTNNTDVDANLKNDAGSITNFTTKNNNFLLSWLHENFGVEETITLQQLYNKVLHLAPSLSRTVGETSCNETNEEVDLVQHAEMEAATEQFLKQMKTFLEWFRANFPYYYDQCSHCASSFRIDSSQIDHQIQENEQQQLKDGNQSTNVFCSSSPELALLQSEQHLVGTTTSADATSQIQSTPPNTDKDIVGEADPNPSSDVAPMRGAALAECYEKVNKSNETSESNENTVEHDYDSDDDNRTFLGYIYPSPEEVIDGKATRTELYQCHKCNMYTRFPRYNSVTSIARFKKGRCGEYSLLLYRILRSLNFQTVRYVVDWADHVWCEVGLPVPVLPMEYETAVASNERKEQQLSKTVSEPPARNDSCSTPATTSERHANSLYQPQLLPVTTNNNDGISTSNGTDTTNAVRTTLESSCRHQHRYRWIHLDPCEAAVDEKLLYQGWGKKQTFIIAFFIPVGFPIDPLDVVNVQLPAAPDEIFQNKLDSDVFQHNEIATIDLIPFVEDVTMSYTTDPYEEILKRRWENECSNVKHGTEQEAKETKTPFLPHKSINETIKEAIFFANKRLQREWNNILCEDL